MVIEVLKSIAVQHKTNVALYMELPLLNPYLRQFALISSSGYLTNSGASLRVSIRRLNLASFLASSRFLDSLLCFASVTTFRLSLLWLVVGTLSTVLLPYKSSVFSKWSLRTVCNVLVCAGGSGGS